MSADQIATANFARGRSYHSSKRELLPETKFRNVLYWERQRSERSGNSLLLALVHLDGPKWNDRDGRLARTVFHSVCSRTGLNTLAGGVNP
jgi:hypothetical protein